MASSIGAAFTQRSLLYELEPAVEQNLNRHLAVAKEWFPHEYVPWSQGRDFDGVLGGEAWEPGQSQLPEVARTALIVNLLTEDNLPSYHFELANLSRDGAWGTWVHRWTAEEGRHGAAIRDYLTVTRAVDPIELERARMKVMETGWQIDYGPGDAIASLAYVVFQELATRISHRNTGRFSQDPICDQLLARIALDENLHMLFYRNVLNAAFELAPDLTAQAIHRVATTFRMPGHGIDNFRGKALQIAKAGIYDIRIHRDDVIMPVLRQLTFFERDGLSGDGEKARDMMAEYVDELESAASRFEAQRDAQRQRKAARQSS